METDPQTGNSSSATALADALTRIVGKDHVLRDEASRDFYAVDFSEKQLQRPSLIIQPASTKEVQEAVEVVGKHGFTVVPRGGGMSYTLGYLPLRRDSVTFDMRRMNRIVEINEEDGYITVESGVTWKQIRDALSDKPYRIPFGGTMSGVQATVGGGLGNNATGVGKGDISDYLLGVQTVLADGSILETGGRINKRKILSLRNYGPDLTGLFINDAGAFGVKTEATFKLLPRPKGISFASFGFIEKNSLISAMIEIAAVNLATEAVTLGRYHHQQFAGEPRPEKQEARAMLAEVMNITKSRWTGVRNIVRVISSGGVTFLKKWAYSLHIIIEGANQNASDSKLRHISEIATRNGGRSISPVLAIALRAQPFNPIDRLIVGKDGECSFPSNCTVPLSEAKNLVAALDSFFENKGDLMKRHRITTTRLYLLVKGMFGCEPIIYWRDAMNPLRFEVLGDDRKKTIGTRPANTVARDAALALREDLISVFRQFPRCHFQIGKYYPYGADLEGSTEWEVLKSLKHQLDPDGIMNPGALGL